MDQITANTDISIVVPFYKNLQFLERLSISLAAAITVSPYTFELIVVIDSIENTPQQINHLLTEAFKNIQHQVQLKVLKNEQNIGVAASRNKGIENANGHWIHFIDQDDTISSQLYQELTCINNADLILFNGYFVFENKFKHSIYLLAPSLTLSHFIVNDFVRSPGQVILKRSIIKEVQFRTALCAKGCDDRFFWIELLAKNAGLKTAYCRQKLYNAHLHTNNFGSNVTGLYACSNELWKAIQGFIPVANHKNLQQNLALLDYLVNGKRSWANYKAYFAYQFNANKMLRFMVKKTGLFFFKLQLFNHD